MPKDLIVLDDTDEDLRFEAVDETCFQIFARYKGHALFIQPRMSEAKKIRDWLNQLIEDNGQVEPT